MLVFSTFVIFSSVSFFAYGISCLIMDYMKQEFQRYGLARWRVMTGLLQILGGAGLIIGLYVPLMGLLAAAGLALLMFLGTCVRLRIKDGFVKTIPALVYCLINLYLITGFICMRF